MIGFIGLGDIGLPMATRLLDLGHPLTVWNRTPAKAVSLVARGAVLADSPATLFQACDLVGMCLTSHVAVEEVAEAMFASPPDGAQRVVVDLSTGAPERTVELARSAAARGCGWVDSPVSGGVSAAAAGTLTLFVGGDDGDIEAAAPILDALGGHRTVMGGPGAGQTAKICNQMIVSCTLLLIAETIAAARRAGIDVSRLPEALRGGFADGMPLQIFGPRMAGHDFEPRLGAIALMAKDLGLARAMADRAGAHAPLSTLCADLYAEVDDADADLSRLIALFEPL